MPKYKEGDVCYHKANPSMSVVILEILPIRWFRRKQKYWVSWYEEGFQYGTALEAELKQ